MKGLLDLAWLEAFGEENGLYRSEQALCGMFIRLEKVCCVSSYGHRITVIFRDVRFLL
jgi:hypothetical protein